jgi:hypothetical protein
MTRKEILKRAVRYTQIVFKYCLDPWQDITFKNVFIDITENMAACTLEMLEDMEIEPDTDEHARLAALAVNLEILNLRMGEMRK